MARAKKAEEEKLEEVEEAKEEDSERRRNAATSEPFDLFLDEDVAIGIVIDRQYQENL